MAAALIDWLGEHVTAWLPNMPQRLILAKKTMHLLTSFVFCTVMMVKMTGLAPKSVEISSAPSTRKPGYTGAPVQVRDWRCHLPV